MELEQRIELFNSFRPDVKEFLNAESLNPESNCFVTYKGYENIKKTLSRLCGFDAEPENFSRKDYDSAIRYVAHFTGDL